MKNSFLTIVLIVFLCACSSKKPVSDAQPEASKDSTGNVATLTDAQLQTAGIQTDSLQTKTLSALLKVNGSIDVPPQNMVSVSVPLGGYLRSTDLLPGMHVRKGQAIASIEDIQYIQLQQDYLTTKSQLSFDKTDYERQKELNKSKAVSDKIFQQSEATYNNRLVMLSALAQKLKLVHINPDGLSANNISKTVHLYAAINGFVSKVNVNIGKYVTPSDVLFELVDPSDIHLNLVVFEKDVSRLSVGQPLLAYNNNQPDKKYRCKIILISKDLSNERTVEVHCHFEDYEPSLLPGMYMNADIETSNHQVYALPEEAIVNFEGKNFVFVDSGNHKYQLTPVATGITENHFTEIKNADSLLAKRIVTKGAYTVLMKLKNTGEDED